MTTARADGISFQSCAILFQSIKILTYIFHVWLTQDKELHAAAPPAAGPAGVQAQRRGKGVPSEGRAAPSPHRAPPGSAGPQVAEGPAGGAALRPQAGGGQGDHQGLC